MDYLKLLRPRHWLKNFLIFVPLFFVGKIFVYAKFGKAAAAFAAFCLIASSVYIINDLADKKKDKEHPLKKNRPVASERIGSGRALFLWFLLTVGGFAIIYFIVPEIIYLVIAYIILNLLYSFYFKKIPILDLLLISGFYLMRIEVGGITTATPISRWLVLCIIFVSLFVILGKRMAEIKHSVKREVLSYYTEGLLSQFLIIAASLTIVSYGLYSVEGVAGDIHSPFAVYSIFLVLLGILRYLFLIHNSPDAEEPEKLIFKDNIMLGSLACWILYMFFVFYK